MSNRQDNIPVVVRRSARYHKSMADRGVTRCTAKSKQTQKRCKMAASPGCNVCSFHGVNKVTAEKGARTAAEQLKSLTELAISGLKDALLCGSLSDVCRAAQLVLDRTGFGPSGTLAITGKDGGPVSVSPTIPLGSLSIELRMLIEYEMMTDEEGKPLGRNIPHWIADMVNQYFDAKSRGEEIEVEMYDPGKALMSGSDEG